MTELWKDIEGYDGLYQVSNFGRIRSVDHYDRFGRFYKGKIRVQVVAFGGYLRVNMKNYPTINPARAVAMAFVPGYFEGAEVNHKDENPKNNRWDNLEWVTHRDNLNYGNHNSKHSKTIEKLWGCKVEQYSQNGHLITTHNSIKAAADYIGVCPSRIRNILDTNQKAKGFHFKRKTN